MKRLRVPKRSTVMPLLCLTATFACDTPGLTFVDPESLGSGNRDAPYTVRVVLEDTALAATLGWTNGVSGAEVIVHRFIDPYQPDTLMTDSTGRVVLPEGLLSGHYRIAALRVLTDEEATQTGGVIRAFGDGLATWLPATSVELMLGTDNPGSLVFSEIYYGGGTQEIRYRWSQFVEFYNNSDTTVYLDGLLFGSAYGHHASGLPCSESRAWREDPLGLWAIVFYQFPGGGSDFPVMPGEVITVAMDAADHSVVHPTLPDLSRADFELEGPVDTDNPSVPNMPSVGPLTPYGHGMSTMPEQVQFLSLPVNVDALETALVNEIRYARIPADRIIDVLDGDMVNLNAQPDLIEPYRCKWVNREFDRLESVHYRLDGVGSMSSSHRRIIRAEPGGRRVLQDVNTTFLDFVVAAYSPGRIEY